ncbi:MAG: hypothetical protein IIC92_09495, partial [Chloroflexi bacterium]|nr:hypothetical protein [Chloroflexota bacterium]
LKTASNTRPLVLVLDDLHWSDRPSLTFLEFVAREIGQSRLMIIATYRDMELNRRHPLSVTLGDLSRERLFERVLLRGLSEADIARFIEIASGITAPRELSATIRRHTEGNPLFVTEVVRDLVQSGELAENVSSGSSTWSIRIPEGVREVIGRRLDRLSERANEMLTTAAVVGRDFRLEILKALVEDTTEGQLLDVLDESLDAKIIEELSGEVGHYQFTHALMQETLTSELSLTRRVRLHARIAETLETHYGERAEENASELAYHYVEAEAVLGSEKMLRYSVVAGEQAMEANGPEEALAHFERAEAALAGAEDDSLTGRVWFGLGIAGSAVHGFGQAQTYWDYLVRAFDWFLEHEDTKSALAVAQYPASIIGMSRGTVDLFERALLLVPFDSVDAGLIGVRLGPALMVDRGDVDSAIQAGEQALRIGIATEQGTLEARALFVLAFAYMSSGDATTAMVQFRAGLEKARQHGDLQTIARLGAFGVPAALAVGDLGFARELTTEMAGAADSLRDKTWLTRVLANRLDIAVVTGSREDVASVAQESRNTSDLSPEIKWLMALAEHEFGGDFDVPAFLEYAKTKISAAGTQLNGYMRISWLVTAAHSTRSDEMFNVVEPAVSTVIGEVDGRIPIARTTARVCLGLAAVNKADAVLAEAQYGVLKAEWDAGSQPYMWTMRMSSHRVLGLLAATFGDAEAAATHFEDALEFAEKAGYVRETVWTQMEYAEMLLDRDEPGDREKAIELQDEALAITQELGMRPLTERILARREILRA